MSSTRFGRQEVVTFHYDKKDKDFVILLYLCFILHHCNSKNSLYICMTLLKAYTYEDLKLEKSALIRLRILSVIVRNVIDRIVASFIIQIATVNEERC